MQPRTSALAFLLAALAATGAGCGDSSSAGPDGGVGDGGGDPTGDGGNGDGDGGATSNPRTVSLTLPNRPTNAGAFSFLVAYQDGSAAWKLAPAPTGDTYSFPVNAPSYGVAFTCISGSGANAASPVRSVTSAHFAVSERTEVTLEVPSRCTDRMQGLVTLSGTVSNRPFGGVTVVQFGARTAFVGGQTGAFSLTTPPGTQDLVVSHAVSLGSGEFYIDQAVVVRDVAVTGPTTRTIDFNTAQETQAYDVAVSQSNARVVASTVLYTANGTQATLVRRSFEWESDALAQAQRRTTDVYDQQIVVSQQGRGVTISRATSTPTDQTYVAPAALGQVMTTVPVRQPYILLESTWSAYTGAVGYTWTATQQGGCAGNLSCTTVWTAHMSPGVVGASPAFRMPDLSSLPGWKQDFQMSTSTPAIGSVTAVTSNKGPSDFPTGIPVNGTQRAFVRSDFATTP